MKRVFIFLILITLFLQISNLYSQDKQDKVIGGFKECIVYKTEFKLGKLDTTSKYKEVNYFYDDLGKRTKRITYNRDGSISSEDSSIYDLQGKIDTIRGYNICGETVLNQLKHYDEDGNLLTDRSSHSDVILEGISPYYKKDTYRYDKNGNLIEKKAFLNPNIVELICKYKYDIKGNKIEELITNAYETINSRETYKYDKNRNIIERITYIENGQKFNQKFKYKYDALGNETEEIIYKNLKEPTEKREYIYTK